MFTHSWLGLGWAAESAHRGTDTSHGLLSLPFLTLLLFLPLSFLVLFRFFLGSKTRKKQQCTPLGTVRDSLLDSPIVFLSFLLSTLFYSAKSFLNTAKLRLSRGLFDGSVGCVSLIGITIHDLALSIFPQHSLQSFLHLRLFLTTFSLTTLRANRRLIWLMIRLYEHDSPA